MSLEPARAYSNISVSILTLLSCVEGIEKALTHKGKRCYSRFIGVPTVPTLPELSVGVKDSPGIGYI